jgi:2-polyprenyl-3-methyl-5-hydroxy-6-metoxy-1,4-benzoquinol methylase
MSSIKDDRGYNQGFKQTLALNLRTKRRAEYILRQLKPDQDKRILEIGCGTGQLSAMLAGEKSSSVLGVDLCVPFIAEAKSKFQGSNLDYDVVDFNQVTVEEFLAKHGHFDAVVGNGILHHLVQDLDNALETIKRLVKPGGKIVFLEPNLWNPYCFLIFSFAPLRKLAKLEPDEMAFTRTAIYRRLLHLNFQNVKVVSRDFLLPNTPEPAIKPIVAIGGVLESVPGLSWLAQSLFISADV